MCIYDLPMCPCAWVTYRVYTHVAPQQSGPGELPARGHLLWVQTCTLRASRLPYSLSQCPQRSIEDPALQAGQLGATEALEGAGYLRPA